MVACLTAQMMYDYADRLALFALNQATLDIIHRQSAKGPETRTPS